MSPMGAPSLGAEVVFFVVGVGLLVTCIYVVIEVVKKVVSWICGND